MTFIRAIFASILAIAAATLAFLWMILIVGIVVGLVGVFLIAVIKVALWTVDIFL